MIDELVLVRTDSTGVQLFRYTLVGGTAFALDFGALYLLTHHFGVHYLVSAAVAFLLGLGLNYALSVLWVFDSRVMKSRTMEFLTFLAIGIVGLGFNEACMWLLTDRLRVHYLNSKLASTAFVYLWNFFARKFVLFR